MNRGYPLIIVIIAAAPLVSVPLFNTSKRTSARTTPVGTGHHR
ncbi:MAG: hypothetical protein WCI87_03665 [Euryarchaeota archaeon]